MPTILRTILRCPSCKHSRYESEMPPIVKGGRYRCGGCGRIFYRNQIAIDLVFDEVADAEPATAVAHTDSVFDKRMTDIEKSLGFCQKLIVHVHDDITKLRADYGLPRDVKF